jgi:hypothetical protein
LSFDHYSVDGSKDHKNTETIAMLLTLGTYNRDLLKEMQHENNEKKRKKKRRLESSLSEDSSILRDTQITISDNNLPSRRFGPT